MLAAMLIIPEVLSPLGRGMRPSNFIVPVLIFSFATIGVRRWLVPPYRRLMDEIHTLQRNVAISSLREAARRRVQSHQNPRL